MAKDLVFAARSLRNSPAFTLTAVLTIALGIGASIAIFSVFHAVLLRPLPYADPQRLAIIWGDLRARNVVDWPFSGPDFDDLRRQADLFDEIAGVNTGRATVPMENAQAGTNPTGTVTPNFFRMMGARMALGRDFTDADGVPPPQQTAPAPQPPAIGILSTEYWQKRFGGDPTIVGRRVDFGNGRIVQIVGVLQPRFELLFPPKASLERMPEIWIALRANFQAGNRNNVFLRPVGRIKQGVTFERAQAQVDSIAAELRRFSTPAGGGRPFPSGAAVSSYDHRAS